jgi:PAS domain S-box-containing protein
METQMTKFNREELVQTLFEESGDALFLFDPDSEQLVDVNPTVQRLSGFTRQELLRMPVTYFFRSEVSGGLNHLRHAFRKTGVFHSQEGFLLRSKQDGVWVPLNLTITRLHVRPKILGLITARDIREQRETHAQLKRVEAELRRVLASISDYLWSVKIDAAGRARSSYSSPVVEKLTGRPPEFYAQWPEAWLSTLHAEDRPRIEDALARLRSERQTGGEYEYRVVWPGGSTRWLRNSLHASWEADGQVRLDGVVTDITERKSVEAAVLAGEARYRSLTENLEQCIFLKDRDLRFLAGNRRFCEVLGFPESELVGKTDADLYPPELAAKYQADDRRVLAEGKRLELEEHNPSQGELRTVRVVKTPVRDAQGQNVGVLGIFWDVTDQRALEAQLRQAQKMEAVGQLAGGVAHDFNNILTIILGNAGLLRASIPEGNAARELVQATEKAALRAAELTRKMLGFSRRTALHLEPASLNACVEETVALLHRTIDPRIRLTVVLASDLWQVQADPGQVNQVLMNLCINARDAMPAGGTLHLETANVVLGDDAVRLRLEARAGEFVRLRVQDSGTGISPEVMPRIYEPFFTTKEPGRGTGLGLAMVFGIVKQHRGWLECASRSGEGTRFEVYLPRSVAQPGPAADRPNRSPCQGHETILLVDDEAMIRNLGRTILQGYGYRVQLAEDGLAAVELYRRERGHIDLVVLDLTMPRLSGQDTLRQLVQIDAGVRVLFASGYSAEHIAGPSGDHVLGFVGKPYCPQELALAVRTALDRHRLPDGAVRHGDRMPGRDQVAADCVL